MKRAFSLLFAALIVAGCPSSNDPQNKLDSGSTLAANAARDAGADAEAEDEVRPVYDVGPNAPIDPLAKKFCAALSEIPEKKRAACCNTTPGVVVTDECVRMLSAAVTNKAAQLVAAEVDSCIAALDKKFDGCDWVGPFIPGPPPECTNVIKGTLAAGARCRSSLECAGELRCHGVGPTRSGKCAPAKADGLPCGGTVDPLVDYARQTSLDTKHPECEHRCFQHKCAVPPGEGGACTITADCADGLQCLDKKCKKAAPAKLGDACPGGVCEAPADCVLGKCSVKKAAGEACTKDFECKGGCLRGDGGAAGKCGPRCDIR